ncbi:LppX_LprAFG lipoprotein [Nostocoides australiense]|nr:LppX_LprAFG lipoprotein [Tetrasphaera australiensis]
MRRRAVLAAVLLPVAVVACSGEKKAAADPAAALAAAKTTLDGAQAVTLDLKSDKPIPSGHNGVSAAKGTGLIDPTTPKFQGTVSAVVSGAPVTTDVITIGDTTWMKLFTPTFTKVDLKALNAPNPGSFFKPDTGLSQILAKTSDAAGGTEKRFGKEVLTAYTGKVPGAVVKSLLNLGADTSTYAAEFGIAEGNQLRTATLTGPFYDTGNSSYEIVLTDYGKTVEIAQP